MGAVPSPFTFSLRRGEIEISTLQGVPRDTNIGSHEWYDDMMISLRDDMVVRSALLRIKTTDVASENTFQDFIFQPHFGKQREAMCQEFVIARVVS